MIIIIYTLRVVSKFLNRLVLLQFEQGIKLLVPIAEAGEKRNKWI